MNYLKFRKICNILKCSHGEVVDVGNMKEGLPVPKSNGLQKWNPDDN